jgi:glycosyltransferase involved in cell wall biosynthesis
MKGVLELVEAFKILKQSSMNVMLVLLGYGQKREFFAQYVSENSLDDIIKLRGPVDHSEVPTYIAACDACITTMPDDIDFRYQNPIKVLEFLAMNKPILLSDIPAHRWIIGDQPVALYLKRTDPSSIAEGVRSFLTSHDKLRPMLGEKIVRERFTPQRVADILENQIRSCETSTQQQPQTLSNR